jgi:hypothetical protein
VQIRVRTTQTAKQKTPFASLIGIWEDLSEKETTALDKALARARKRSASNQK